MPIRSKPRKFNKENISNAPDDIGVYSLRSRRGTTTYIGRSKDEDGIKGRLQDAKRKPRGRSADSFQAERSKHPAKREKQLLEQYKKKYGRLPYYNDRIG